MDERLWRPFFYTLTNNSYKFTPFLRSNFPGFPLRVCKGPGQNCKILAMPRMYVKKLTSGKEKCLLHLKSETPSCKEARGPLDIEEYVSPCLKDQTIVL